MTYNSEISGEITITPPLTLEEMQAQGYNLDGVKDTGPHLVRIRVHTEETAIKGGLAYIYTGTAIIPASDEEVRAHPLQEDIQRIVNEFPDRTYSGFLYVEGWDNLDAWRLYVKDGRAIKVVPEIIWPEP